MTAIDNALYIKVESSLSLLALASAYHRHRDADHVQMMVSGSPPTFLSFTVKTSLVDIIESHPVLRLRIDNYLQLMGYISQRGIEFQTQWNNSIKDRRQIYTNIFQVERLCSPTIDLWVELDRNQFVISTPGTVINISYSHCDRIVMELSLSLTRHFMQITAERSFKTVILVFMSNTTRHQDFYWNITGDFVELCKDYSSGERDKKNISEINYIISQAWAGIFSTSHLELRLVGCKNQFFSFE